MSENTTEPQKAGSKSKKAKAAKERQDRLALALRQNLRRRKGQAKERADE